MTQALSRDDALARLSPEPALVVLMCGIAGSGKTTFSQALEARGFRRISIDEEIWRRFGRYGLDYAPDAYGGHVTAARAAILESLRDDLQAIAPAVIDSSFRSRAHRDAFKQVIEQAGGTWRLVYLRADPDVLRSRLERRRDRFDANAALPIDEAALAAFVSSFEAPVGEGELVVEA